MALPVTIANQPVVSRINRQPAHSFELRVRPFQIVPFMLAPVLPGETLESLWFEAREVTDPLASNLRGVKSEWHFFYVKLRDMAHETDGYFNLENIEKMFTAPLDDPMSSAVTTYNAIPMPGLFYNGGVPWLSPALTRIVADHFRDVGEESAANHFGIGAQIDGYPAAQVREQGWQDSLTAAADVPDSGSLGDPSATTTPEDLQMLMNQWELLQSYGWTEMTFEDYLAQNGVNVPAAASGKCERLFSFSKFTYPSNTIDPADGSAIGAGSWVFKEMKRDKKRFTEPGFVVGVHVVRPKVFFGNRKGSLANFLTRGFDWLPAVLADNPETSLRKFEVAAASDGPLGDVPAADYFVDMRDLFVHGDSFVNFAADTSSPRLALPDEDLEARYPSLTDINAFFKNEAANLIRSDGFASLTIRGTTRDHTRSHIVGGL